MRYYKKKKSIINFKKIVWTIKNTKNIFYYYLIFMGKYFLSYASSAYIDIYIIKYLITFEKYDGNKIYFKNINLIIWFQ